MVPRRRTAKTIGHDTRAALRVAPERGVLDAAAFEQMVLTHAQPLTAFAWRYVQSDEMAIDVVQDVFAQVWQRRADIAVRTNLRAYLFAATRNRALNALAHAQIEAGWRQRVVQGELERAAPDASELAERTELSAAVAAALRSLPPRAQEIARLRMDRPPEPARDRGGAGRRPPDGERSPHANGQAAAWAVAPICTVDLDLILVTVGPNIRCASGGGRREASPCLFEAGLLRTRRPANATRRSYRSGAGLVDASFVLCPLRTPRRAVLAPPRCPLAPPCGDVDGRMLPHDGRDRRSALHARRVRQVRACVVRRPGAPQHGRHREKVPAGRRQGGDWSVGLERPGLGCHAWDLYADDRAGDVHPRGATSLVSSRHVGVEDPACGESGRDRESALIRLTPAPLCGRRHV